MNKIILETKNLKKSFEHVNGTITLFKDLNIKIKEGDLVALVGPSGSGKSTFLHLLALLDDPSRGRIIINKEDTNALKNSQKDELRMKYISIIFQDNNLLTDFTAIENVMMPLIIKGENNEIIKEKAEKILKDVKIINRSNHFPNELSGGEQQRVAIARALIAKTKLILADEPTGNLDVKNARDIFKLLFSLRNKNRIIIFATHNRYFADMSDCKLSLIDGKMTTINARN